MSDVMSANRLQDLVKRLRERAQIEKNDVRHRHYVGYVNEFVSHFGHEKAYLVGSTAEQLKIRWSKDGGDADFILCSGLFEIPVENLVAREATPCFVWIKTDGLESKIKFDLIEGGYLPTKLLRTVSPELFTILRGIHLIVTSNLDSVGRESRYTTTSLSSRVGLARTEYHNLKVSDERITDPRRRETHQKRHSKGRNQRIEEYKQGVNINQKDKEMLDLMINMVVLSRNPESTGLADGRYGNFAHVMYLLQKRRELGSEATRVMGNDVTEQGRAFVNDLDEGTEPDAATRTMKRKREPTDEDFGTASSDVHVTYQEKTTKDFVPAIRIKGQLPIMRSWKKRAGFWPLPDDRDRIANCEVFVVSRYAPISPDQDRDFCLSFNQAELQLARCMSDVQRDVFLILKSYLKGGFQVTHDKQTVTSELKLKTFHVKTALYWVSEIEDRSLWKRESIMEAVRKVLDFIYEAVDKTELQHYFIPDNNLFAGLEMNDADLIKECISKALDDPVGYIEHFFSLDNEMPVSVYLARDELEALIDMQDDGGVGSNVDAVEEAIVDFHRGFNSGPRDSNDNAPIINAIESTYKMFVRDVERGELADLQNKRELAKTSSTVTSILGALRLSEATNTTGMISGLAGGLLYSRATQHTGRDHEGNTGDAPHARTHDNQPGTSEGGAQSTTNDATGCRDLLAGAMNLFTNRKNMDRESRRQVENELKYKAFSAFLGKPW